MKINIGRIMREMAVERKVASENYEDGNPELKWKEFENEKE